MKSTLHRRIVSMGFILAISGLSFWAFADAPPAPGTTPGAAKPEVPASQPAGTELPVGKNESAEQVIQELMRKRQDAPAIEPVQRPVTTPVAPGGKPTDPVVLGTAPDVKPGQLRREGEFVVNRRGRVVRAAGQAALLFVFDGDSAKTPEPPMILVPCQKTQSMEDVVRDRGDRAAFIVTGQILVYRGANYLLPTITKEDLDRGNIQH